MTIGLVLPNPPTYSETFFSAKIHGLKKQGHEVILFTKNNGNKEYQGCQVIPAPKIWNHHFAQVPFALMSVLLFMVTNPGRALNFIKLEKQSARSLRTAVENLFLSQHILSSKLDWLHFGFSTMALRRENVAQAMGAKMAVSFRGFDIAIYPVKNPGCYDLLWKRVDKIHTISGDLLDKAYEIGLSRTVEVQKIPPAIDTHKFKRRSRSQTLGSPPRLITVGRLHWKKGLEYTLQALALLHARNIDFSFSLYGEGVEYERLVFAAHQMGISSKVNFMGKVEHSAVKDAMEKADIYLQYSIQEGFSNAVLEAQAMQLLCVVSDAEGLPENVMDRETGWVVERRDPGALAECLSEVLGEEPEVLMAIRQNARKRVESLFNVDQQEKAFHVFYSND